MQVGESITQRSASNLAFAFVMLPAERRQSMCALYAFCREVDDIADDDDVSTAERAAALQRWRDDLTKIYSGGQPEIPVNVELKPVIEKYKLPYELFDELLLGVTSDLEVLRYPTDADLRAYCYRVASVVGLLSIEIFGYEDPQVREYAVKLGYALQYTNILRDVKVDAERDRIYLPLEDLTAFGVKEQEILDGRYSERYQACAASIAKRAKGFYQDAARILPRNERPSMVAAEMMGQVYWKLLCKLEANKFDVFSGNRIRVSKPHKIFLLLLTWLSVSWGIGRQPYRLS